MRTYRRRDYLIIAARSIAGTSLALRTAWLAFGAEQESRDQQVQTRIRFRAQRIPRSDQTATRSTQHESRVSTLHKPSATSSS